MKYICIHTYNTYITCILHKHKLNIFKYTHSFIHTNAAHVYWMYIHLLTHTCMHTYKSEPLPEAQSLSFLLLPFSFAIPLRLCCFYFEIRFLSLEHGRLLSVPRVPVSWHMNARSKFRMNTYIHTYIHKYMFVHTVHTIHTKSSTYIYRNKDTWKHVPHVNSQ